MTIVNFSKENIRNLATAENYDAAISLCNSAIALNPDDHEALSSLSYVYKRMGRNDDAYNAISTAIGIAPEEPAYLFARGRVCLDLGTFANAESDFSEAIHLEESSGRTYYLQSGYFFRALARLYLKKYKEVIEDCIHVQDDFSAYELGAIRTKKEVVATARANLPGKK